MKTVIHNAILVNEGKKCVGTVVINEENIETIIEGALPSSVIAALYRDDTNVVEAQGMYLLPGVIDEHVHFREPGMTHKATIASESRKAVAGGVTSFMEMPNCIPPTTTLDLLRQKYDIAESCSPANYSFYLGATADNLADIEALDPVNNCGIKVFMGSSTGGMLLNDGEKLHKVFMSTPLPIALHCEDQQIIARNAAFIREQYGDDPEVKYHPIIRSEEACYRSSAYAVELAEKTGANIHILHISTARELSLFTSGPVEEKHITAEVCTPHLLYTDADYERLGTAIKCNPAVKTLEDRNALRHAICEQRIDTIGTDHAPHTPADKVGGALKAASGIASLPHSLTDMLALTDEGVFSTEDVVRAMCHNPALRYKISQRGFIREGFKADLVLLQKTDKWTIVSTWVNGLVAYTNGKVNENIRGQRLSFDR